EGRSAAGRDFVGNDAVVVEKRGQRQEEGELKDQAARRIAAQQDVGNDGAHHRQHARLDERVAREIGKSQLLHHGLPGSHTVMPGCRPATGVTGSSRSRKLLRSWSPTARAARQVANSPSGRSSVTRAAICLPSSVLSRTSLPTVNPPNASSRTVKANHLSRPTSRVSTGLPTGMISPSSATRMPTVPSAAAPTPHFSTLPSPSP